MNTTKENRLVSLMLACGLAFGAISSPAQQLDQNEGSGRTSGETNALEAEEPATNPVEASNDLSREPGGSITIHKGPIVVFGRNVELPADESAEAVVVIGGSATVHGHVQDAVVAIGGDVETDGQVGDTVVAVLGSVKIGQGAHVRGDVVAVGGKASVETNAVINGNLVAVGGTASVARGASVRGNVQEVDIGIPGLPRFEGLAKWVRYCVLELRPMAPQVRWVWVVAGLFFVLYLLVAVAFPRPVQICVSELTERPASTFLIGLLTKLLVPVVVLVLLMTGIGVFVLPFLFAALFFAAIVGKVALLEYLGNGIGRSFDPQISHKPVMAFVIGAVLLAVLYIIPVIGFIAYGVFGLWALGAVVTASFRHMRRETPPRTVPPAAFTPPPAAPSFAPAPPLAGGQGGEGEGTAPPPSAATAAPAAAVAEPPAQTSPALPEPLAHPKAGFWERMGAGFLDLVLVGIVAGIVGGGFMFALIIALAYFSAMWAWKGTTIGGVVLKLKVVRSDGVPMTFLVALVRGLTAAFSIVVLFLGFLWVAWDKDKQGWHDKIAGTDVISLPRSVPLVCL